MSNTTRLFAMSMLMSIALIVTGCGSSDVTKANNDNPSGVAQEKERSAGGGFFSRLVSKPKPVVLAEGTVLRIRTLQSVSSKSNEAGDGFEATLAEPLIVGDKLVAEKGAEVRGIVSSANPGGRVKGRASLSVRLTELETTDGVVDIATNAIRRQARGTKAKDAAKIGIGSGIGAAIGAIAGGGKGAAIGAGAGAGAGTGVVLATRGEPAVLPSESLLSFRLTAPVTVTPRG